MKTFIIAAVSADGFIAKDATHAAFWTSKEDKARFVKLTREAGVVIMGSTTYATLPRPLKERRNIVYTKSKTFENPETETTQEKPQDLIERLKKELGPDGKPIQSIAICGGSQIYSMFLKARVVDKIYLTIEPIIFGKGISLFNEELSIHLKLVAAEGTPSGSLLLEYDVDYHGTNSVQATK
jgi:dihydrofolate reductase